MMLNATPILFLILVKSIDPDRKILKSRLFK